MTTLSIPISSRQEAFINALVKSGKAANKAHAVRQALDWYREEEFMQTIFQSKRDIKAGRVFEGDLRKIVKKFND